MLRDDLGMRALATKIVASKGEVAAYAGNHSEAESIFAAACQESLQHGAPNPTVVCDLATAVLEQGRPAEVGGIGGRRAGDPGRCRSRP